MKKIAALGILVLSLNIITISNVQATTQLTANTKTTLTSYDSLVAGKVTTAYDKKQDPALLKKLKAGKTLTIQDKARLEVIYEIGYVGEEELDATDTKIYDYAKKILPSKIKKLIETKAQSYGM